ncbi:MAG TPA: Uma2 family endonuclease [Longimicrobium sp.]|jgi:Uma2 family endonuclease
MPLDAATRRWAYERPEFTEHDGFRYEYIAGELVVTRFSSPRHQEVIGRLLFLMYPFAKAHQLGRVCLGPVDIVFAIGDLMAPDLAFVRRDHLAIIDERAIEGPPDLIVEVVHEVTEFRDRGIKRERYAQYGVPEYWIVDPWRAQIDLYRLVEDADVPTTLTAGAFEWQPVPGGPALTISLEDLFKNVD